jgi:hypothetical protein
MNLPWNADYGLHPERDRHIKTRNWHGDETWKERVGYGRRSLAETGMSRYKTLFGGALTTRTLERQAKELELRTLILNAWTNPLMQIRTSQALAA